MRREGYFTLYKRENGIWYYCVYDKFGRRHRYSTDCKAKCKAMDEIYYRQQENRLLNPSQRVVCHKFLDYTKDFWNYDTCPYIQERVKRGQYYSPTQAQTYGTYLVSYIQPYFAKYMIEEITTEMVKKWHQGLPSKYNLSESTANKLLGEFRIIMNQAITDGIIEKSPCDGVLQLIERPKIKGCFTDEDIAILFSTNWESNIAQRVCYVASKTGMRVGEILALTPDKVHSNYIEVSNSYKSTEGLKSTKSGKNRIVPINNDLYTYIMENAPDGYIFSTNGKVPSSSSYILKELKLEMAKRNIDYEKRNLSIHSFRHYVNTKLVAAGISETQIRAVIGHESASMTDNYLHLSADNLNAMCEVLSK